MKNIIPSFPQSISTPFKQITLTINYNTFSSSRTYYLHSCKNIEYSQLPSAPAQQSLETIYFITPSISEAYSTPQVVASRQEGLDPIQKQDTLYFINNEESDS